jgi:membrane associated rhomboid family serine protease
VFVLVLAVPALLVVILGYVVGFRLWSWIGGLVDSATGTSLAPRAEVAGWVTGLLLLLGLTCTAVVRRRRRPAPDGRAE